MGYYTRYDVTFYDATTGFEIDQSSNLGIELLRQIIAKIEDCYTYEVGATETIWYFDEALKWYDHHCDMTDLALKYPNVIFKLTGEGEERDDVWVKYYHGEKFEGAYAELIYPQPQDPVFNNLQRHSFSSVLGFEN